MSYETFCGIEAVDILQSMLGNPDIAERMRKESRKGGGYLCIADQNAVPLVIMLLGEPDPEKLPKYFDFCQEKAKRLAAHPEHDLSRQSRNPEAGQWGGAVRGDSVIYSFSGLSEHLDELYSLLFAVYEGELEEAEADSRLGAHPNEFGHLFSSLLHEVMKI